MKKFTGIVTSTKMEKTAVVVVTRLSQHPVYKKTIKRTKKYLADDKIGVKEGQKVIIEACRPISKRKRFRVIEIIKANKVNKASKVKRQ